MFRSEPSSEPGGTKNGHFRGKQLNQNITLGFAAFTRRTTKMVVLESVLTNGGANVLVAL
jgi:hypothetical protein